MARADRFDPDPPSPQGSIALVVALTIFAIAFGVWRLRQPDVADPELSVGEGAPPDSASPVAAAPLPPRCAELSPSPWIVGEAAAKPVVITADGGAPAVDPGAEEVDDPTAPFAVEMGRGTAYEGGFAVGVRRDAEGGALAMVALVHGAASDGVHGDLVKLGRSRGDLDAPVVAAAGASVLTVMIEPNASGRALKVAKITNKELTWGPELSEGRDESLGVGIAASGDRAVVVWDDLVGTGEHAHSTVMLASFDVATMHSATAARPSAPKDLDASLPHVVAREGGYWLGYLAHGEEETKKHAKGKKDPRHEGSPNERDESDDQGEVITTSWIEVVPLDATGSPLGMPSSVSPRTGHVLGFDMSLGANNSVIVAFRDDETPTGASGGTVSAAVVRLGGGSEPRVLAERAGGPGAPELLPGWISIASVSGATRIAALSPSGSLLDELAPEPSLGAGEPVAASPAGILWARPMGKAMRLSLVRCSPRPPGDAGP